MLFLMTGSIEPLLIARTIAGDKSSGKPAGHGPGHRGWLRWSTRCEHQWPSTGGVPWGWKDSMVFSPLAPDWKPIVWTEEERKKGRPGPVAAPPELVNQLLIVARDDRRPPFGKFPIPVRVYASSRSPRRGQKSKFATLKPDLLPEAA